MLKTLTSNAGKEMLAIGLGSSDVGWDCGQAFSGEGA